MYEHDKSRVIISLALFLSILQSLVQKPPTASPNSAVWKGLQRSSGPTCCLEQVQLHWTAQCIVWSSFEHLQGQRSYSLSESLLEYLTALTINFFGLYLIEIALFLSEKNLASPSLHYPIR